jgi:hypothetical protein
MTIRPLLLCLLLAGATACSSSTWPTIESTGDAQRDLERHRERFDDAVGDRYRVTYENNCFCPIEATRPVRLTVRNGAVTEVVRLSDGVLIPQTQWAAYRTVEEIFDTIDEGLRNAAKQVNVDYHPRYGYPEEVLVDYNMAADAFVGFKLRDLDPLR